ncbi:hypothetical protein A8C56_08790 [Niabella ginsenosidivorans]|uniref:Phytase-like domain-containing protein n=1 Tax=Niabella ginsenosidivorans TaxID=1176587 RepID=A0A1A9I303_9BACT|nr:hypothetical protein [Niabella ginsenosidivorans]ANH81062.1 hypothetical protein A8C56_08790 [Niabella ginsenosidivorans]
MRILIVLIITLFAIVFPHRENINMRITSSLTVDSLGACQGAAYDKRRLFLYGDRETGIIREYRLHQDSVEYLHKEYRLTINGEDLINHPTGIAMQENYPVFIGNSIRLNKEGTLWKAVIYNVNWEGLLKTGNLDRNLLNTIEDDACIQGTRPEYVQYKNKWYVATADYGNQRNEVRLYDPKRLQQAKRTSEKGVLVKQFTCSPWVQNLHWMPEKGVLLLIRNQVEGRKWRFSFVDLEQSITAGKEQVLKVIDIDREDELEGFSFLGNTSKGVAVSSSRRNNVNLMDITWQH